MNHSTNIQRIISHITHDLGIAAYADISKSGEGHDGTLYRINNDYCIKITTGKVSSIVAGSLNDVCSNICVPIKTYAFPQFECAASIQKYINGDSLQSLIKSKVKLSENEVLHIVHDVLLGLNVLHSSGFVHRDFHPSNILLDNSNGIIKPIIIDLDDALPFQDRIEPCFRYNGYHAPEIVLLNEPFDNKSEVFSVGVIMWELLFGQCEFGGYDLFGRIIDQSWEIYQKQPLYYNEQVKKAIQLLPESLSRIQATAIECGKLLYALLNPDKDKRISADAALQNAIFANF